MILHATINGDGPPVLLLHGLFGAGRNLGQIARPLGARFKVAALDLRNHGESPRGLPMDYATMAADVAETMAAAGLGQAIVIGHSMGGKTAMALALSRPELVSRLAVLDIAPVPYRHEAYEAYVAAMRAIPLGAGLTRAAADAALAEAIPEAGFRAFLLNSLTLHPTARWRLGLEEIEAAMADLLDWRDPPGFAPYRGPALFLHGGASDYVRPAAHEAIRARFPQSGIETVAGAGHWLHAEKPEQVASALLRFLG